MEDFSVFFMDPMTVDFDVYSLWLEGLTEEEAARQRKRLEPSLIFPPSLILNDTKEQYQLFKLVEKFLQNPLSFKTQMLCLLSPSAQEQLIQDYYRFDKDVIREILGKKMSAKLRKDMDDVSEKTGIPLKRCRRQFDNIKSIVKAFDDGDGSALDIIQKQFLLKEPLASIYASMVFVFVNRFDTSKKRLSYLSFDDFIFCAGIMLKHWCSGDALCDDDELERNFFHEIRDIKNLISDKDINDQMKLSSISYLEYHSHAGLAKCVDTCFRNLSQKIFQIGSSMSNSKDVRDFFNQSVEKVVEQVKQLEWNKQEFELFLDSLIDCENEITSHIKLTTYKTGSCFARFMKPMKDCLLQMYHS